MINQYAYSSVTTTTTKTHKKDDLKRSLEHSVFSSTVGDFLRFTESLPYYIHCFFRFSLIFFALRVLRVRFVIILHRSAAAV